MKKLIALLLACLLLLTACGSGDTESEPTSPPETTEPAPVGLYVAGSQVESQTGGAVRSYDLGGADFYRILPLADKLLLFSGEEKTCLTLLTGIDGVISAQVELHADLRDTVWQLTDSGIAYYDPAANQAVYLDTQLQELHRVELPEGMNGNPAISADGAEVYYCSGQELRGLDTQRGISRLIKSQNCKKMTLAGSGFDGKVLTCITESESGELTTVYVSAENGATKGNDAGIRKLQTYEDLYFAYRMDGITPQYLTGSLDGTTAQWNTADVQMADALAIGMLVGFAADADGNLQISGYDVATGQKTAFVSAGQIPVPISVCADRWSNSVWMLQSGESNQTLLRWDVTASAVTEEAVYTGAVITADAPDEAGLKEVQKRVNELNDAHGVSIRIWQDAVKKTGEHALEAEYQIYAIHDTLDKLEPVLQMFPESFLRKSVNSRIRFCIVRSVDGGTGVTRFWESGDAYIILPVGTDFEKDLVLALSYVVDSHILGNSPLLDAWEGLNPEGFTYGSEPPADALEGETRAFADAEAAGTVADDRARIFWHAMQPDNGETFASPIMQSKLLLLCQAIRDAWRLERKTETFPWEQYLTQSIAYTG